MLIPLAMIFSLTVDEVEQYIQYNPGYANATGYSTRPKSCD